MRLRREVLPPRAAPQPPPVALPIAGPGAARGRDVEDVAIIVLFLLAVFGATLFAGVSSHHAQQRAQYQAEVGRAMLQLLHELSVPAVPR